MTKYQKQIYQDLKEGAKLQCTEGANYKVWMEYPDGTTRTIRRDSAEKVCDKFMHELLFHNEGIFHRKYLTKTEILE